MPTQWEITQEAKKIPTLNNPILIEGLPGIGNVGKIAVDFLIEEFKAQKLFSFFSYKFPNSVFVNEKNLVDMPRLQIYYKKFGPRSKKRDMLLLTGDIQPIDEESCYIFCEEVLTIAKNFKCKEIITTGGIGLREIPDHPKVYCTSNSPTLLKEYTKKGMPVEKKIFGVVGPIIGASGILLGLGRKRNIKAVSLLAETFGHPMFLGVKGAKEILHVFDKRFNLKLNLNGIKKDIVEMEKKLVQKTNEWLNEVHGTPAGAQQPSKDANYIG